MLRAEIERLRSLMEAADELYASLADLEQTNGQREAMAEYAKLRNAETCRVLWQNPRELTPEAEKPNDVKGG